MSSLKEQKELFVTGHDGTSPWEILLVCSAAPVGIWLFQGLQQKQQHAGLWKKILVEALVLWVPFVICQTNWLYYWGVGTLLLEFGLAALFYAQILGRSHSQQSEMNQDPSSLRLMKDVMTVYRSSLMYLTFVAILAVDFHVFPRRFAKTEVAGFGLMDLGAGSFIVAAGLVSPRARQPSSAGSTSSTPVAKTRGLQRHIMRILPLWGLGFVRLATNKGLEYQEHVSEYGVHWNFFFTLAMITPVGSLMPGQPTWKVPLMLLAGYQVVLSLGGWQTFIESGSRTECFLPGKISERHDWALQLCTLLAANREGVMGCVGYLVLYLSSEYIACLYLWNQSSNSSFNNNQSALSWAVLTVSLWGVLALLVEGLGIPVSRRSTNASFCVWTLAHNLVLILGIRLAMGSYCRDGCFVTVPVVFQAINRHGFLAFLVANLLTGLVNLTINTLAVDDSVASIIVFVYLCAVGVFALVVSHGTSRGDADIKRKSE